MPKIGELTGVYKITPKKISKICPHYEGSGGKFNPTTNSQIGIPCEAPIKFGILGEIFVSEGDVKKGNPVSITRQLNGCYTLEFECPGCPLVKGGWQAKRRTKYEPVK